MSKPLNSFFCDETFADSAFRSFCARIRSLPSSLAVVQMALSDDGRCLLVSRVSASAAPSSPLWLCVPLVSAATPSLSVATAAGTDTIVASKVAKKTKSASDKKSSVSSSSASSVTDVTLVAVPKGRVRAREVARDAVFEDVEEPQHAKQLANELEKGSATGKGKESSKAGKPTMEATERNAMQEVMVRISPDSFFCLHSV